VDIVELVIDVAILVTVVLIVATELVIM